MILFKNNYLTLRLKVKVPQRSLQKTIIWPWGQRSRSHKGHYGTTRSHETSLRYATHLPYGHAPTYQISLTYLERKMLWPGQENTISKTIIW